VIQDARDTVGNGGGDFAKTGVRDVRENSPSNLTAHIGKGIAVEEQKRGAPSAVSEELYGFVEGEDGAALFFPLSRCRFLSLSIKATLRSTSFARSSVEADDKLPTPVFEKRGLGL
jgi:hypothetical protein